MQIHKKIYIISGLLVFMITGIAATCPPNDDDHYTNLKVLPKKISSERLERIMTTFERQLGVTCLYCHVRKKDVLPQTTDFASDEKIEKKIARQMLKMTLRINKKYFNMQDDEQVLQKPKVWCRTCHHGVPAPEVSR